MCLMTGLEILRSISDIIVVKVLIFKTILGLPLYLENYGKTWNLRNFEKKPGFFYMLNF